MMSDRLALIVATYEYQDTGLRQLVAPAQDAKALARVLEHPEIGGFDVQVLLDEPSHRVNQQIEDFFTDRKLKRDDLLLFYFSGHGIKDEEGRLYFATPNTFRTRLRTTAIPATLIHDVMRYSRSGRQVLVLDCCYSGAFPKGMVARSDEVIGTKERFEGRGRVVLTASDAMQYAFEGDVVEGQGARSVFSDVLVHGLETGAADLDRDGQISLDELYEYVYDRVIAETPQQRPGKWAFDVQGDIIIAKSPGSGAEGREWPVEPQAVTERAVPTTSDVVAGLRDRLRFAKQIVLRNLVWLVLLLVLVGAALAVGMVLILQQPTTDESFHVGIARFLNCREVSDELSTAIGVDDDKVKVEPLGEIQDVAAARDIVQDRMDLIIWGSCDENRQLTMYLQFTDGNRPAEVIGLENVTAQASALNLEHFGRLGRAVINYLRGDHNEASGSFAVLQKEAEMPSEQSELAFLQANSLLFQEEYETAISVYDKALAYGPTQVAAYNNRGVAGANLALAHGSPGRPHEGALQAAIADLEAATTTTNTNVAALAFANLGAARYLVDSQYSQAEEDCKEAINRASAQPRAYVCRAGARLAPLLEAEICEFARIKAIREDLARAQELATEQKLELAEMFFWLGSVANLQANKCDESESDKREHEREAEAAFREYLDLSEKETIVLETDRFLRSYLPRPWKDD